MLNINYSGTSSVVVTLFENCINQIDPYFTWQLVRDGSLNNIIFTADDISPNPNVYNKFVLSIGSQSSGLTHGVIPVQSGQYNFYVYEMTSQYDLNLNNNIGMVKTGILNVVQNPITSPPPVFTGTNQVINKTFVNPSTAPIPVFRGFTVSFN